MHQLPRQRQYKLLKTVANKLFFRFPKLYVVQDFVLAKLDDELYKKVPGGCCDISGKIVRPNTSLFGLKQSERQWAGILVETAVLYGMEQRRTDPCVFCMVVGGKVEPMMAVHVGDMMIAGSDETSMPRWLRHSPRMISEKYSSLVHTLYFQRRL